MVNTTMKEHLLEDLRIKKLLLLRKDPCTFIREYCKFTNTSGVKSPFIPTNYQHKLIQTYNSSHTIVNHARCSGITTTTSLFMLWHCFFNANKVCGIISNKQVMSNFNLDIIREAYNNFPDLLKQNLPLRKNNRSGIEFDNGSQIIAFSSNPCSLRGTSLSLLHMDNFGSINDNKQDEILSVILPPMLSSKKSRIIMTSCGGTKTSPFSKMFSLAEAGLNNFKAIYIKPDR